MNCAVHTDLPATAYCRTCGRALCEGCKRDVKGVIFCQDCLAARLEGTVPAAAVPPSGVVPVYVPSGSGSPVFATLLGFIPGVGAFYNGQFTKGFIHVGVFALLISLQTAVNNSGLNVLIGFGIAIWYFYMVFDAYTTAKAKLLGQPLPDPLGLNNLFGPGINQTTMATPIAPPLSSMSVPAAGSSASVPPYSVVPQAAVPRAPSPGGAIWLIAIGVIFLLSNFGFFEWRWVGHLWPLVLIAMGLWMAYRRFFESGPGGSQPGGPQQ
jgi:hypothetical protein